MSLNDCPTCAAAHGLGYVGCTTHYTPDGDKRTDADAAYVAGLRAHCEAQAAQIIALGGGPEPIRRRTAGGAA